MLTLFTVATPAELMHRQLHGCSATGQDVAAELCKMPEASPFAAPLYFVTFILFGTMIVLNLFIGVIMNSNAGSRDRDAKSRGCEEALDGSG